MKVHSRVGGQRLLLALIRLKHQLGSSAIGLHVQTLGSKMGVAPKHLPIFVTSDERNLFDRKPSLKEPTCPFMTEVMEMQIVNPERLAGSGKHRAG